MQDGCTLCDEMCRAKPVDGIRDALAWHLDVLDSAKVRLYI